MWGRCVAGFRHHLDDLENDDYVRGQSQRDKVQDFVLKAVLGWLVLPVAWMCSGLVPACTTTPRSTALRKPSWRRKVFKSIMQWPDHMDLQDKWEGIYTTGAVTKRRTAGRSAGLLPGEQGGNGCRGR